MKQSAEGRENGGGFQPPAPPFAARLAFYERIYRTVPTRPLWLDRLVNPDGPARMALERLYANDVAPEEVLEILGPAQRAVGGARRRRVSPTQALRDARELRALRRTLEALEIADPFKVTFRASWGDPRGGTTWSWAQFLSDWLPRYLESCASNKIGVVTIGRPADQALRRCAERLADLIQTRTGQTGYAELGTLLFAAFPRHFHRLTQGRITTEADDHADAARALLRRAAKNVPKNVPAPTLNRPNSTPRQPRVKKKTPR